jgi:hypothetical protein
MPGSECSATDRGQRLVVDAAQRITGFLYNENVKKLHLFARFKQNSYICSA